MGPTIETSAKSRRFAARLEIFENAMYAMVAGIAPALLCIYGGNAYWYVAAAILALAILAWLVRRIISCVETIDGMAEGSALVERPQLSAMNGQPGTPDPGNGVPPMQ